MCLCAVKVSPLYALPVFNDAFPVLQRMCITDSPEKNFFENTLPRKNFATED